MREALIGQNSCTGMHTGLETEWFIALSRLIKCRKNQERRTALYKILIKHNPNANKSDTTIWRMHASITTSATTTYTEFATDDIVTLKTELLALDAIYGSENLKVVKEIDINYSVNVADPDTTTENNPSTGDTTDENKNNGE